MGSQGGRWSWAPLESSARVPTACPLAGGPCRLVVLELGYDTVVNGTSAVQKHWALNNATFLTPATPTLYSDYKNDIQGLNVGFTPTVQPAGLRNYTGRSNVGFGLIEVKYGTVVQLVIQNNFKITMNPHPFHLHGFNFYVVGQ